MKKIVLIIFMIMSIVGTGFAQTQETSDVVIGKTYHFEPQTISGRWEVQVSVPGGYANSNDSYPVVYALHGDYYFKFAVGGFQRLMEFGDIPNVIIVGISNESNAYFAYGTEQADKFLDFMEKQIFPLIEANYRVHRDRTVLGWHYTAGFIFHALSKRPDLFKYYVPASPYLGGFDTDKINFQALERLSRDQPDSKKVLSFGVFSNERTVKVAALGLDSLLRASAPKNLDWEFQMIEPEHKEGIGISVYRLWRSGLKSLYAPYKAQELSFENLEALREKGGLNFLKAHYKRRAEMYGGSSEIPNAYSLIRMAQRADDFALFDTLMSALDGRYENINLGGVLDYAAFYLKNDRSEKAIEIYENVNTFYPNSISVYDGLGAAYIAAGKGDKAILAYEQAIKLSKLQGDDRLETLAGKLADLK